MAYERRKKKRLRKKKFRLMLISIIILYMIIRSIPSLLANNAKTTLPEKDILINKDLAQAVIIKKENLFNADASGELKLFLKEGDRASSGTKVASINIEGNISELEKKLSDIEKSILVLEASEKDGHENLSEEKLEKELEKLVIENKYEEIYLLKEKIDAYKNNDIKNEKIDKLIETSLEELKIEKQEITNEINSYTINYYTNVGGIISYEIDGYEDKYIPRDFEKYTYDEIDISKVKINDTKIKSEIVLDEAIYKIIDNFEWYMGIKIEDLEKVGNYEKGKLIRIEIKEDEEELLGRIIAVNNSEDKSVLIVKFNTMLHNYYNKRFAEVYLVKDKIEGYKIPSRAVIEKDSIKGVYIKDTSGIVRFRPIKILEERDKNIYVDMGDRNSKIEIIQGKDLVETISTHDEIFLNTNSIKEGQIIK